MKVERLDGKQERRVLTGLITDPLVLGRLAPRWDGQLFASRWANLIAGWCFDYHKRYEKAPGKAIEGLFDSWAGENPDKDVIKLVDRFLGQLSDEYETLAQESNTEYVVDTAAEYFNRVRLQRLKDEVEADLDSGELEKALKRVNTFSRVELGAGAGVDVLDDPAVIKSALLTRQVPLVKYKGALGNFFQNQLARGAFVAFEAPLKTGKSYWLQHIAWTAMRQKLRVGYFCVGDMTQEEMTYRLVTQACRRPLAPAEYRYPTYLEPAVGGKCPEVTFEERETTDELDWQEAYELCRKVTKKAGRGDLLKLFTYPSLTVSASGINDVLEQYQTQHDWEADVVCVDHAENLAPVDAKENTLQQSLRTWKILRALSQKWNHCLVTATQSGMSGFKADVLDKTHSYGNKLKGAETTAYIGINQNKEEKELDVTRLNYIAVRSIPSSVTKCVYVAGCRAVADIAVLSTF